MFPRLSQTFSANMKTHCSLFLLAVISLAVAEKATFNNYKVYRIVPRNFAQLQAIRRLHDTNVQLSFWKAPSREHLPVDVMVPPHLQPEILESLERMGFHVQILMDDVQRYIDNERSRKTHRAVFDWEDYYPLETIYSWLDSLAKQYPGVVTPIVGGKTYEGRQIRGVKVSYKEGNPGVFIEGGIHAREWISPATVTYILNKFLTSDDPIIRDLAESYDYYVFPSFNPDGYAYTHSTNRMWRKTRSPGPNGSSCFGADPNRNWDFYWMSIGASSSPCSETYAGSAPFSEIEAKTLSEFIGNISSKLQVYLAFHSYSQLLMIPYGHTPEHISNHDTLVSVAKKAVNALAANNGTSYRVGNIYETIYPTSGVSMDWVRGTFDLPVTYTWELRDTGRYGFLLPADQIIDTAEETLNSVIVILQEAKNIINAKL